MPADSSPSIHLTPLPLYSQKVKSTALCHRSLPADFTCSSYHNPPPRLPAIEPHHAVIQFVSLSRSYPEVETLDSRELTEEMRWERNQSRG